jgi:hypothetical protein
MNADLLLYWMSRLGSGSREKFTDALQELAPNDDQDPLQWYLPGRLSDLAHADFLRSSKKWKVRPPILAGLAGQPNTALLCGARSSRLVSSLQKAADEIGLAPVVEPQQDCPSRVLVTGNPEQLARLESTTGIPYMSDYSLRLLGNVPPISQKLQSAQPEKGIINWQVNMFDLATLRWVPFTEKLSGQAALPKQAAVELKSKFEKKYCVTDREGVPRKLPKHEAVYAAASLSSRPLIQYNTGEQLLSAPLTARMPEVYTRIACLCSGELPHPDAGRLNYPKVPPLIAATLMVLAGQPHPGFPV